MEPTYRTDVNLAGYADQPFAKGTCFMHIDDGNSEKKQDCNFMGVNSYFFVHIARSALTECRTLNKALYSRPSSVAHASHDAWHITSASSTTLASTATHSSPCPSVPEGRALHHRARCYQTVATLPPPHYCVGTPASPY